MTEQEENDIQNYLIDELIKYGFRDIVREVNDRIVEDASDLKEEINNVYSLEYFLRESVEILKNISNDDFDSLIKRLNSFNDNKDTRINTIEVELISNREPVIYNLEDLPSYAGIISTFEDIIEEIKADNANNLRQ